MTKPQTRKEASRTRRSRDVSGSTARRAPAPVVTAWPVRATHAGFYGGQRIRVGQEFYLESPEDFSEKWMERLSRVSEPGPAPVAPGSRDNDGRLLPIGGVAGVPAVPAVPAPPVVPPESQAAHELAGVQQPTGKADVFGDD
jgi:hypothetical protein